MVLHVWVPRIGTCLLAAILLITAPLAASEDSPEAESAREQSLALAAETSPTLLGGAKLLESSEGAGVGGPLFVGVDDATIQAQRVDVVTNGFTPAFVGFQVWGAAYDPVGDQVYFNNGSTLYVWPVGGAVSTLGTIVNAAGAAQSMVGLAFYNGTLYGVKNIANEAIWTIDTTTLVATVQIDYVDADLDCGGFAIDPADGAFYCTNDDSTPHGTGLKRINGDASVTSIAPYPAGQTDIDGLAVGGGRAYLVTDEPGSIYVWDLALAAYQTPLANPWATSEVFSAGAWIEVAAGGNCGENFDGVTAPALPAGWTAITATDCATSNPWANQTTTVDTAPNAPFVNDPNCISDERLESPTFPIASAASVLTFRNNYDMESGFDGGVLEVSINGGAFQDILAAGASFGGGGYNGVISVNFGNPLAGRQAWTNTSAGFVTTTVNLPASANGQNWRFRFRRGSDSSVSDVGWRIDTLDITGCGGGGVCTITPPQDIVQSNDLNQCGAVVNYPAPTLSGDCGPVTCAPASGSFFPVGTTTVTCSDPSTGASATFDITVNDTQTPTVLAPDLVVPNDPGLCSAVVNYGPQASDNCPGVVANCVPPGGGVFPVGVSPVTCTATDAAGNVAVDGGSIAVNDVEAPTITCPADIELDLPPGSPGQNVDYDPPVAGDNCGVVTDCQPPSGDYFLAGQTPVTCTANDPASNTAQCTFYVTLGAVTVLEVPTVSSLGLLALGLLLAAAAFGVLRRNSSTARLP